MGSPILRDPTKATILFFLGIMAIAMIGGRIHTGIALVFWGTILLLAFLVVLVP